MLTWGQEEILQSDWEFSFELYQSVLGHVKAAQEDLLAADFESYENSLVEGKQLLQKICETDLDWLKDVKGTNSNLRLLNNYYKNLFSRALEDRDKEALAELKYHLMEIVAAWKS